MAETLLALRLARHPLQVLRLQAPLRRLLARLQCLVRLAALAVSVKSNASGIKMILVQYVPTKILAGVMRMAKAVSDVQPVKVKVEAVA